MRVVCLVPSWTETLIECGVDVVGRTRYCVHPSGHVESVPVVGGTKDVRFSKIAELKPDVILADKEENRKEILGQSTAQYLISHVESLQQMPLEISKFQDVLGAADPSIDRRLGDMKKRWEAVIQKGSHCSMDEFPGLLSWVQKPTGPIRKMVYFIWKNPEMVVGPKTFIGSMLSFVFPDIEVIDLGEKYPQVDIQSLVSPETLFLFSSEPFPFMDSKNREWIELFGNPSAIVDGEVWSWFGIRSLKFLESLLANNA